MTTISTILTPRTAFELLANVIRLGDPHPTRTVVNPADPTRVEIYRADWWLEHHLLVPDNNEHPNPTAVALKYTVCGLTGESIELEAPPLLVTWHMGPGDRTPSETVHKPSGVVSDGAVSDLVLIVMTLLREADRYDGQDSDEPPEDYWM